MNIKKLAHFCALIIVSVAFWAAILWAAGLLP